MPCKSRHNEVAPGQHEMSPIFEDANLAIDHNNISMEIMKEIATNHNLACLLHEKPFAGVNGSGKHNNWSIITDYGLRLLHPGADPANNLHFILTLAATIRAVDEHADVLRASIVTPGNDFRLGANEAPPAIISIYLGEDISALVNSLIDGKTLTKTPDSFIEIANPVSPIKKDTSDRNRTSPFAFTGNKFEFRAVGSSQNVGVTCTFLNAIVADSVRKLANDVEKRINAGAQPEAAGRAAAIELLKNHQRIIFDGHGYTDDWVKEAEKRGLPNYKESVAALEQMDAEKNVKLFSELNILSEQELKSRKHIFLEFYSKTVNVEGQAALNLVNTRVLPASFQHQAALAQSITTTKSAAPQIDLSAQEDNLRKATELINGLIKANKRLESTLNTASDKHDEVLEQARYYRDEVKSALEEVRHYSDSLEEIVDDDLWSLPKYSEILYIK
jgi:glutamine synthetase